MSRLLPRIILLAPIGLAGFVFVVACCRYFAAIEVELQNGGGAC